MRDIKFRGKDIKKGEWLFGSLIINNHSGIYNIFPDDRKMLTIKQCYTVDEKTVGQYTGLKDKKCKEIYEGDIVTFEDSDGWYEYPDVVVNTGIVEYGELGFYFTNRVAAEMDDFYIKDGRCDDVEVIGNIHENPELLEGKHE